MSLINELDEDEIWFIQKMITEHNGAGRLVETKLGIKGRTYNSQELINGKFQVHCVDGSKILCSPENLKLIGFID